MQKSNINLITRRGFLSTTTKAGMAAAVASLVDIPLVVKRALAEGNIGLNGKKVLFIWLRGANDALNSVIPIEDTAYGGARPTLNIPKDPGTNYTTLGPADFPTSGSAGSIYGNYPYAIRSGNGFAALHPTLKFLAPVYNAGDMAIVHRVAYPRQSRSHFDSQAYWETGYPGNGLVREGIFYRTMIESGLANTAPLTGVSIQSSLPVLLRGSEAAMTNLSDPTRYDLLGVPNNAAGNLKATNALFTANNYPFPKKLNRDLLRLQYGNMEKTLGVFAGINFTESGNTFRDDLKTDDDTDWYPQGGSNDADGYYLFPTTAVKNGGWRRPDGSNVFNKYAVDPAQQGFFNNLKAAALVLNKTDAIIAGTQLDGFDTHNTQGGLTGDHPNLNRAIGWSIYALRKYFSRYADKVDWNNVVVVTFSEFGRTTVENSDMGTDHAEGNVMFVAGGNVKGYDVAANRSGIIGCSPTDAIPWKVGPRTTSYATCGTMWAAGPAEGSTTINPTVAGYLRRSCDYRSVLGEIIRKHLGATQNQLNRIIPGYAIAGERLLAGGISSVDNVAIRGEVGLL